MSELKQNRKWLIEKRKAAMPKSYRANYDKAVSGNSLRSAINAQCLECVYWHVEEIRNCTDLACPLYAVRPYSGNSQSGLYGHSTDRQHNKKGVE